MIILNRDKPSLHNYILDNLLDDLFVYTVVNGFNP